MHHAEKALIFFRVFDIAFFAPGVVLVAAIAWVRGLDISSLNSELLNATGLAWLVLGLAAVFSSGLVVHSITWMLREVLDRLGAKIRAKFESKSGSKRRPWKPLPLNFPEPSRSELVLYFWYLRSTCWNLATAFVLSCFVIWRYAEAPRQLSWEVSILVLAAAFTLILQGRSYGDVVHRSLSTIQEEKDGPAK